MGQTTLDDDDLFGEAAEELAADVTEHLAAARAALPAPDAIWEVDAGNTLGVLNTLRSALDVEEAERHLRRARKWYALGERADAFGEGEDPGEEIAAVAETIERMASMRQEVAAVASALPELRERLADAPPQEADPAPAD